MGLKANDRAELLGGVIGFAICAVIGVAIFVYLSIQSGVTQASGGFQLIGGIGLLGATLGQFIARGQHEDKQKKSEQTTAPPETPSSWVWPVLMVLVFMGSFGLAILTALLLQALQG